MRSEKEMYDLILGFAKNDERIRAIYMNGSRANPKAPKDCFQDYDIVYVVRDTLPFIENKAWIDSFGKTIVMQEPGCSALYNDASDPAKQYTFLMLFEDGNRIDLKFQTYEKAKAACLDESLAVLLLDKDQLLPPFPPSTDDMYRVKPPTPAEYRSCCNEFWWVSTYIAKGLWRKELLYAIDHLNNCVRPMLLLMLDWQAGFETEFTAVVGKCHKYLKNYMCDHDWEILLKTYPSANAEAVWSALFTACDLFERVALSVAEKAGFDYDIDEEKQTYNYLREIYTECT